LLIIFPFNIIQSPPPRTTDQTDSGRHWLSVEPDHRGVIAHAHTRICLTRRNPLHPSDAPNSVTLPQLCAAHTAPYGITIIIIIMTRIRHTHRVLYNNIIYYYVPSTSKFLFKYLANSRFFLYRFHLIALTYLL